MPRWFSFTVAHPALHLSGPLEGSGLSPGDAAQAPQAKQEAEGGCHPANGRQPPEPQPHTAWPLSGEHCPLVLPKLSAQHTFVTAVGRGTALTVAKLAAGFPGSGCSQTSWVTWAPWTSRKLLPFQAAVLCIRPGPRTGRSRFPQLSST